VDERLDSILHGCLDTDLNKVVAGSLEAPDATLAGQPEISEIAAPHNDLRTLGIVRVSGMARLPGGTTKPWSAVAKVIDLAVAPGVGAFWTHPENEDIVYEHGYFASNGLPFRPARCYHVSRPADAVKVLWLEDLGEMRRAPFDLNDLATISRHLGEWNGFYAARMPDLPFETSTDSYLMRWTGAGFGKLLEKFREMRDDPSTRQLYGGLSPDIASDLYGLVSRLNDGTRALPHSLAFGDCSVANLFLGAETTIAIDWASLTSDPLGVDAGCTVGSAITWGRSSFEVAASERQLFESYLEGLAAAGWTGNRRDIRRAFLGQYCTYLFYVAMVPATRTTGYFRREFLEQRYQATWDEIPTLQRPVVQLIPSYIDELKTLTG
jgi:hypothetical protein